MAQLRSFWQLKARGWLKPEMGLAGLAAVLSAAFVSMLGLTSERGAVQVDNSAWQVFAQEFLEEEPLAETKTAVPALLAYAQIFVTDGARAAMQRDLQIVASLETFTHAHFKTAENQKNTLNCLSQAIYYEARSEPVSGQLAVAQVVLNRVRHRAYPSSVCAVVFEGSTRHTGCQFSFTCDGSMDIPPRGKSWTRSRQAALHAMLGVSDITIGRATHYHTVAVNPVWSGTLLRTANIGTHIFYRFPSRREKALLAADAA